MRTSKMLMAPSLIVFCLIGCQAKSGDVSGTVRFQGQVVPSGRVTFYCAGEEQPVLMSPIVDGDYHILGAPVGDSRITVETFQHRTTRVPGQLNSPIPDDVEPDFEQTVTGEFVPLPVRYRSPSDSKLTYTIAPGPNTHDLDLEE